MIREQPTSEASRRGGAQPPSDRCGRVVKAGARPRSAFRGRSRCEEVRGSTARRAGTGRAPAGHTAAPSRTAPAHERTPHALRHLLRRRRVRRVHPPRGRRPGSLLDVADRGGRCRTRPRRARHRHRRPADREGGEDDEGEDLEQRPCEALDRVEELGRGLCEEDLHRLIQGLVQVRRSAGVPVRPQALDRGQAHAAPRAPQRSVRGADEAAHGRAGRQDVFREDDERIEERLVRYDEEEAGSSGRSPPS